MLLAAPALISASASVWVADLLAAPIRTAGVVHAGPHAVYLRLGGSVLAVLGRDAIAVPCGLRTPLASLPTGVLDAQVGDGRCIIGPHEIAVRRIVDAVVPTLVRPAPDAWPTGLDHLLIPARSEIPPDAVAALRESDPNAVRSLLGLGSGLTPTGDDVLAGWLVAAAALGIETAPVAQRVRDLAPSRTNTVSGALLAHATAREAIPQVHDLLRALSTHTRRVEALHDLVAVGHTSGAGLALGIQTALQHPVAVHHLTARSPS